jgi:transcriptional regulator with XRE-family HTH domain
MLMCVTASPYNETLAANVRAARARLDISQASVARRMAALGYRWTRQTVSEVEAADRRLLAEEVCALSFCLETRTTFLLPEFGERVEFPTGRAVELMQGPPVHPEWGARRQEPALIPWDGDTPASPPDESQKAAGDA